MQNVIVLADLLSLVLFSDGDAVTPEGEVTFLARERVQRNIFLLPNSIYFPLLFSLFSSPSSLGMHKYTEMDLSIFLIAVL